MIAFAWKMLAWFGIGVVVALGVLIVPLHVAAERKKLDTTTQAVAQAERDIRALETEFETRANIAQLERWNGETLRLSAPVAGQYVRDEAALASLDFNHPLGGPPAAAADVRMASAIVPAQSSAPTSMITPAVATTTATTTTTPAATIRIASAAVAPQLIPSRSAPVKTAAVTRKAQAVAMLDRKLLSDSMIGDLARGASAESGRLR